MSFSDIDAYLTELKRDGLLRCRMVVESSCGTRIQVDGREYLAFCSNDYLNLAADTRIIKALCNGAKQYGVGSGASHLVTGHSRPHHDLELRLANFVGMPSALLFSSGYMANIGVVTTLAVRGATIFADKLNHASLNDAVQLSRANLVRYRHLDMKALASRLAQSDAPCKVVISDSVFSMDGDIASVSQMIDLCERHNAWLILDDAHGFGVLGDHGRGILSHLGVSSPQVIYMGTLGKAAGVSGAFVAAERRVIDLMIQRARTYIYTTAMPPSLACALETSLDIMQNEDWRRDRLSELIRHLRKRLHDLPWKLLPSETPIQPLVIGSNAQAMHLSMGLRSKGILVPAIRPPTVPQGTARLRLSLCAAHTIEDVDYLADALGELAFNAPSGESL